MTAVTSDVPRKCPNHQGAALLDPAGTTESFGVTGNYRSTGTTGTKLGKKVNNSGPALPEAPFCTLTAPPPFPTPTVPPSQYGT